jgi:hypothetical protein
MIGLDMTFVRIYMSFKCFHLKMPFLLVLVFALSTAIHSQKPTPTPERDRQIVALLANAQLAAPELTADTFLRVLESKRVTDRTWRKEILDEALRIAEGVKHPVQLRPVPVKGITLNTTEYYIQTVAFSQKLDRLSLKSRIISLLLESDLERARRMLYDMGGRLGLKPRRCEDMMTYEVGDIYATVAKVAKASFTAKQVADGQRALFALPWIENIESPVQVDPVLGLMAQLQGSQTERQMLLAAMSLTLRRRFADDRSFTTAITWGLGMPKRIADLAAGEPDPSRAELTLAYRDFLIKNLTDTRCKENEINKDELPIYIEAANKLFLQKPITFDDVQSSDLGGSVKAVDLLARSSSLKKLRSDLGPLKGAGPDGRKTEIIDQNNADWQARVNDFIDKALSWEGENEESESSTFMVRTGMFLGMLESIEAENLRRSAIKRYLGMLAASNLQKEDFIEWYFFANQIQKFSPDLFAELVPEFPNSNLKVMAEVKKLNTLPTTKPQDTKIHENAQTGA